MAYITLNKKNLFHNLDIITKQSKAKDKIAIVLKDNAYGHGLLEISKMAKEYGILKCVVQTFEEAKAVTDYFKYILVLADIPQEKNDKIRYTINSISSIENFPKGTKVELKVDTGMHRNGIAPHQLKDAFEKIQKQGLLLEALFTHYRSADELTSEWFWQNKIFHTVKQEATELALEHNLQVLRFHSANSASLFRTTNFQEDMVRVGIAVYGCMALSNGLNAPALKPVLSLYSSKISSRILKKGQSVGYGASYTAQKDEIVSNYDFGYGKGFLRVSSNAYQTPNAEKLVGRISMDNSSFISDKDELLIFNNAIDASKYANTISYEVLTSLKADIKRIILH